MMINPKTILVVYDGYQNLIAKVYVSENALRYITSANTANITSPPKTQQKNCSFHISKPIKTIHYPANYPRRRYAVMPL